MLPSHHDLGVVDQVEGEDDASYGRVDDVQGPARGGQVVKLIYNSVILTLPSLQKC